MLKRNQEQPRRVQKKMKNKIFGIIIAIMLLLPATVWAVDDMLLAEETQTPVAEEFVETQQLDEDTTVEESQMQETQASPYKQPIGKKKIVKKFLLAMGGVIFSSLLLYGGLTAYNRVRDGVVKPIKAPDGETSLKTPSDTQEAVKTFLEKTNWG